MYKLEKIKTEGKLFKITIKADYNDGDYSTETTELNEEEFNRVIPFLLDLKNNYSGRHKFEGWDIESYDEEDLERIGVTQEEYEDVPYIDKPYGDDIPCHTLENLEIICIDENSIIYDVILQNT